MPVQGCPTLACLLFANSFSAMNTVRGLRYWCVLRCCALGGGFCLRLSLRQCMLLPAEPCGMQLPGFSNSTGWLLLRAGGQAAWWCLQAAHLTSGLLCTVRR